MKQFLAYSRIKMVALVRGAAGEGVVWGRGGEGVERCEIL